MAKHLYTILIHNSIENGRICGIKSKPSFEKMGSGQSNEKKTADNAGTVNNNLILSADERIDVYSTELVLLIAVLVILRIIEFTYFVYRTHKKNLKKKYLNNNCQA